MNFIRKYATSTKWNIGFVEEPLDSILNPKLSIKIHWMKHSESKSWFADPFILCIDDEFIYVLVEEFYYPIGRGRISKLTVNRKTYQLEKVDIVLELPTHLSFPAILRESGKIFIYPENSASGKLTLYEYEPSTNKCTPLNILCNQPLTDAIVTKVLGKQLIASTKLPNPNKNILEFYSEGNKVKEHIFHKNVARNAGDWFVLNGKMYRPAQDCTKTYGGAVILQEIQKKENGELQFNDIRRIITDNPVYNEGFHTFNYYQGLTVVDAKGFRFPVLNKLFFMARKIAGKR